VKVQLHAFLTLALDGCEWSASRPSRLTPGERELPKRDINKRMCVQSESRLYEFHPELLFRSCTWIKEMYGASLIKNGGNEALIATRIKFI